MFPHPEDLHRAHQRQHAEMMRNHARERQARQARDGYRRTRRFRETAVSVGRFVASGHWWKVITALFTGHNHPTGAGATAAPPPIPTQPASPLGSAAGAFREPATVPTPG